MDTEQLVSIIITVVIPILGAMMTYLIWPFVKQITSKAQREEIEYWVGIAVHAAEQLSNAGRLQIPKKEHVLAYINAKDYDITMEDLEAILEALVLDLNMKQDKIEGAKK